MEAPPASVPVPATVVLMLPFAASADCTVIYASFALPPLARAINPTINAATSTVAITMAAQNDLFFRSKRNVFWMPLFADP